MLIDTVPGSRVKQCDRCGMKWLERTSGHFAPALGLEDITFSVPAFCYDCRQLHTAYVKRHIKRSKWSELGVEE